jgi:pyruvate/2-oxoglutarate dehydrogenase complex dihydrolipoamide dehydrogenase (E3) component
VDICADYKLVEVTDEGAVVEVANKLFTIDMAGNLLTSLKAGDCKTLKADKVILSVGLKPNKTITEELRAIGAEVIEVGSTKRAGNVIDATHDAYEAVYALD